MEVDYIEDGIEYIRISRISGKLGKSTDAVTEAVKRLKIEKLIVKFGQKEVTVLPPGSVILITKYYQDMAAKRPKKVNHPKNMCNEACVRECMGCVHMTGENKCSISIDPCYQWSEGKCWIRKAWEGK